MIPYRIHKHLLRDTTIIQMPTGTQILHVGLDPLGYMALWSLEPQHGKAVEDRTFEVFATGHDVTNTHHYHGTFIEGAYVWHVFEHNPLGRNIW